MSSLTLKYVKYTDAGQYLCTAHSVIGEDYQTAYMEVRCKCFPLSLYKCLALQNEYTHALVIKKKIALQVTMTIYN